MATSVKETETTTYEPQEDGTQVPVREPVFVYTHCYHRECGLFHDPQEDLNHEKRVPGIRVETSYTAQELNGGVGPDHLENSSVSWQVADVMDSVCSECGLLVNVSPEPTRVLAKWDSPGSGLRQAERAALSAARRVEADRQADPEVAELRAQVAALTSIVTAQKGED